MPVLDLLTTQKVKRTTNKLFYIKLIIIDKDGNRKYNGLVDVYKKTLASDGIGGLYRGFVISCVGIFIYRGLYFGLYDTLKPMLLGDNSGFLASFLLGWSKYLLYSYKTITKFKVLLSFSRIT